MQLHRSNPRQKIAIQRSFERGHKANSRSIERGGNRQENRESCSRFLHAIIARKHQQDESQLLGAKLAGAPFLTEIRARIATTAGKAQKTRILATEHVCFGKYSSTLKIVHGSEALFALTHFVRFLGPLNREIPQISMQVRLSRNSLA